MTRLVPLPNGQLVDLYVGQLVFKFVAHVVVEFAGCQRSFYKIDMWFNMD